MNLLPLTSIIEGGGSQGPSPLTALSMIFLHYRKTLLGKKNTHTHSEKVGVEDGVGEADKNAHAAL